MAKSAHVRAVKLNAKQNGVAQNLSSPPPPSSSSSLSLSQSTARFLGSSTGGKFCWLEIWGSMSTGHMSGEHYSHSDGFPDDDMIW